MDSFYENLSVKNYIIMPNHIHMILLLRNAEQDKTVTVADVLCALKSRTTKLANEMEEQSGRKIWQRSFHDHIIRNRQSYEKIWLYIEANPQNWEKDCFYETDGSE